MNIKYLRILHIFSLINLITGVVWAYRYIWFTIETIPQDRLGAFVLTAFVFIVLSVIIEMFIEDI